MSCRNRYYVAAIFLLIFFILFSNITACTGDTSPGTETAPDSYNPASARINSMAGLAPESDSPAAGIIPNLTPVIDAGILAAANLEATNIKTAARAYLSQNPAPPLFTSDVLQPSYMSGSLKAKYYLSPSSGMITRVDGTSGGWTDIVFSLSRQKWVEGTADNNHPSDRDIP
jgi:hypothetical protein